MDVKSLVQAAVVFIVLANAGGVNANCSATTIGPYAVRRFGDDCNFMCHCENNSQCDYVTGNCLNGCEPGWYGLACQYRDIIYNTWSNHIDNTDPPHYSSLAVDGSVTSCSMTDSATSSRKQPPWWRAWLPNKEYITELSIVTKQESLLYFKEFMVFIENVTDRNTPSISPDNQTLCYKHEADAPNDTHIAVICDTQAVGNQVRIQLSSLDAQLVLCDVKINGGRNLAFQRNLTYSNLSDKKYPAAYSVDGIEHHNGWDSCFGTNWTEAGIDQWWTIHFGHDVVLQRLNLSSVNNDRIRDYQVIAQNSVSNPITVYDDKGHEPPTRTVTLGGIRLSKLTIKRVNVKRLVLCEVWLFGDCPEHTCGLKCDKVCHCAKPTSEDKISGNCSMGCEVKWTGEGNKCDVECGFCYNNEVCDVSSHVCSNGCQPGYKSKTCDKACTKGMFGINCSETCGHCKEGTTCHHVNGTCFDGCQPGYTELTCNVECGAGTFGMNCVNYCSGNCKNGTSCHFTNGTCLNGCEPGYTGHKCDKECAKGYFGQNCSQNCSGNCYEADVCNFVNGSCPDGCTPGYIGDRCNEECELGTYGIDCNSTCSKCKNISECRNTDGVCTDGCAPGYLGEMCDNECSTGTFGLNCSQFCSGNCKEDADCSFVNGSCPDGCVPGYTGDICNETCPDGTFGPECAYKCSDNCASGNVCDYVNGSCQGTCKPGWIGDKCNMKCSEGFYGLMCNWTCSPFCNRNQSTCNHVDGSCDSCTEGWTGDKCELECQNGTYGLSCNTACGYCLSGTCDPVHGECLGGCIPGYVGSLCQAVSSDPPEPVSPAFFAVGAVAVLAVIVVSVVLIFNRKRLGKRFRERHRNLSTSNAFTNELYNNENDHDASCIEDVDNNKESCDTSVDRENIYANDDCDAVYFNVPQYNMRVTDLGQILITKTAASYQSEFKDMRPGVQYAATVAAKQENYFKNKYKDMFAYDHTRVKLKLLQGDPDSDYINASYIKGHLKESAYIASQGPIKDTLTDFWRMIWEQDIHMIVMLTNTVEEGKLKCLKYWGDVGISKTYGMISVSVQSEEKFAEFTIRRFSLAQHASKRTSRSIVQYHYTAWPDRGVPKTVFGLQHFWRKVRQNDENKAHTWLVHCSAGVGRTGTFIATDILYDQGNQTGHVNVHDCVLELREQRPSMVQTKDQYVLLHTLMAELFDPLLRHVTVSEFVQHYSELCAYDTNSKGTKLNIEYQAVGFEDSSGETNVDGTVKSAEKGTTNFKAGGGSETFSAAKLPENLDKNRFSHVLASDEHRPVLSLKVDGRTNYINAALLPSYEDLQGYVISQFPLENTVIDCYRLIVEKEIGLIVTFPDEAAATTHVRFLPEKGDVVNGPFKLTFVSEKDCDEYIHRQYSIVYQNKMQTIDQLIYEDWPGDENIPSKETSMLNFMTQVRLLQDGAKRRPTLVQCLDGAERSGLFVTLMNIADYAKLDNELSVPMIVRHMRGRRGQVIANFEQYKFCYEVLCRQLECDATYANL